MYVHEGLHLLPLQTTALIVMEIYQVWLSPKNYH